MLTFDTVALGMRIHDATGSTSDREIDREIAGHPAAGVRLVRWRAAVSRSAGRR